MWLGYKCLDCGRIFDKQREYSYSDTNGFVYTTHGCPSCESDQVTNLYECEKCGTRYESDDDIPYPHECITCWEERVAARSDEVMNESTTPRLKAGACGEASSD